MSDKPASSQTDLKRYGIACTLVVVALWGVQPFFMRVALQQFDAYSISWVRLATAALFYGVFIARRSGVQSMKSLLGFPFAMILAGLFLAINYYTFLTGIRLGGALSATILIQIGPLMLAMVGVVFYRERFTSLQLVAVVVAIIGFFLFYWDRVAHSQQDFMQDAQLQIDAAIFVLIAAVTWVGYCLVLKQYEPKVGAPNVNFATFVTCAVVLLPFLDIGIFAKWQTISFAAVVYLSFSTIFAYAALAEALRTLPASMVSLMIITNPFVTISGVELLSYLEVSWIEVMPLSSVGYFGTCLAIIGVAVATLKGK